MARRPAQSATAPPMFTMRAEILSRIEGFLAGTMSPAENREWAVRTLVAWQFEVPDVLLAAALRALLIAGNPDVTPSDREAVIKEMQSALLGRSDYTLKVRHIPREEIERLVPGALVPMDEAAT